MPLLRAAVYAKGIQIYCAPNGRRARDLDAYHAAYRVRRGCFVLSACQYVRRGDCPADYPAIQGDDPQTVLIRGGSVIVNPLGCVLTGPDYSDEKIDHGGSYPGTLHSICCRRRAVFGCVKVTDTYKSVGWPAVATVGGMMSVGLALEKTGAAGALAHAIGIHGNGPARI